MSRIDALPVAELVEMIKPILAGELSPVQGAVLADLLALWLAGHVDLDSAENTRAIRAQVLAAHHEAMKPLVAVNAKIMGLPH